MIASASEISDCFNEVADRLIQEIDNAEVLSGVDLLETAHRFSSGTLTYPDLERLDHPYARRHGVPLLPPEIISTHTNQFRSSWRSEDPHDEGDDTLVTSIYNVDPKADYLDQSQGHPRTRMFARPIADAVLAEVEPRRLERLNRAVDTAYQALGV